jgi:hypothetical protein
MSRKATVALAFSVAVLIATSARAQESSPTQESPPNYVADPDVFKRVFEDTSFRIVLGTWEAGQTDKPHSNLPTSVAYALTDCSLRVAVPNGKFAYITVRAGTASTVARTQSHTTTNVGTSVCRVLVIERK